MSSLTLTSLLNTLHTHLQSQTQLLPTLHTQLGLPPTALEDELQSLQQHLMQSVESQIDVRRKQVEEWLEKCSGVEMECVGYGKALGGSVKGAGASLGELRKEQVLPRRFQLVTAYQEKLRQVYHTKLEQLTNLTNKLNGLSHTLGSDFFQPDITEAALASGEDCANPGAKRDVTPERFSKLEKELVRGKSEVSKRITQLSETMVQIDFLYTELGIMPPSLDDLPAAVGSSSSSHGVSSFHRTVTSSSMNDDPFLCSSASVRVSTPTPSSGPNRNLSSSLLFTTDSPTPTTPSPSELETAYRRIFARFVAQLEEAESESLNLAEAALVNVDPTPGLLAWASNLVDSLTALKARREAHIQAMYDQLEGLWRRLGVGEEDMDGFVEAHRGSTEEVVREYEDELERMMELKRERMGVFVENARVEIEKLWDDLMIGEDERRDFAPFVDDEHTEELLSIHEEEIKRLKEERRMKAPLLAGIKKYFEICDEEKELVAAATDQTRLLGRGPRDPGRLLREEKMRKRVGKEKPRLEQDLLASIPAWEEDTGRPFLIHGESVLRILMETASATDQENVKRKNAPAPNSRPGSVPPRSTTPVNSINHYVPGSNGYGVGKGVVTPAVRPGSAMGGASNKRQKLGENTGGRKMLGSSQRGNTNTNTSSRPRLASPTKVTVTKTKTPGRSVPTVPKPGTRHHALGHGRVPSAGRVTSGTLGSSSRSFSSGTHANARGGYGVGAGVKKAGREKRESFKPRPSVDDWEHGHAGRWGGYAGPSVKEEDEGY